MRRIVKSGAGSAAVHAAAIGGFLLIDLGAGNQPITIDLTIMAAETMPSDAEPTKSMGPAESPAPSAPAPSPPRVRQVRRVAKTPVPKAVPGRSAEAPQAEQEDDHSESEKTDSQPSAVATGAAPAGPSNAPGGPPSDSAKVAGAGGQGLGTQQAYLARHFAYIRESIQRNAAYPPLARRMGWVGRVVLAFRILADGTVANIRITKGAGFPVLDNGALEAVRRAAPFPRPPAEADIVVPVAYALE